MIDRSEPVQHRGIRSYALRQGRLTRGQAAALTALWPQFGIDISPGQLDLDAVFGRYAPRILDIGSGMGEATVSMAGRRPDCDFLAVEVHRPGVGSLLRQIRKAELTNVRVICDDAQVVVGERLADNSLDEAYILFPDPWPKKRHHKRRLVNRHFATRLAAKLKSHGRLFLATDWQPLAVFMLTECDTVRGLRNLAGSGCFSPRPEWRPLTKFELRGRGLNHPLWDLIYGRCWNSVANESTAG